MTPRFQTLFGHLRMGAYVADAQGRWLEVNASMCQLHGPGVDADTVCRRMDSPNGLYVQPGRLAQLRHTLWSEGRVEGLVSEIRLPGREDAVWIEEHAWLVRGNDGEVSHIEGTVEDISSQQINEQALQMTLENIGRGLGRIDPQGRIVLYNRRLLELLDLPETLLDRQPLETEVRQFQARRGDFGDDRPPWERYADQQPPTVDRAGQPMWQRKMRYRRTNRSGRLIEVEVHPLEDGGAVRTFTDITEDALARDALAAQTEALRITLDTMSQGIFATDEHGNILVWNRRLLELMDLPESLMSGQLKEVAAFQMARGDFGDALQLVEEIGRGFVAAGSHRAVPINPPTYVRHTRTGRKLEIRTRPRPNGGIVRTCTDVTGYIEAREQAAMKQAQLQALVDGLPDQIWLRDAEGNYLLSNPAHQIHLGLPASAILGRSAHALFGPGVAARELATDQAAMASTQPVVYEIRANGPGGTIEVEAVKVAMRDLQGRCVGVLGIARDITLRRQAEAALMAAKDAALASERSRDEFLANMSHEIRTPMNAVVGLSELLLQTPLQSLQQEFVRTIRTSGDALLELIDDILDFTRMESNQLELASAPVDLVSIAEDALEIAAAGAARKPIELLLQADKDVPARIAGDANRLRQILLNLVGNAVKFTERGEVTVHVARTRGGTGADRLHLRVQDTGIGISPEHMDRLFQAFSQADAATSRQFGGTGLGLAISRRLTLLMGGRIWAESTPGIGSCFHVELPCQALSHDDPAPAPLPAARVLVADAHPGTRAMLCALLRDWGLQAQPVNAQGLASTGSGGWSALLLDEFLAGQPRPPGVPVLLLRPRADVGPLPIAAAAVLHKPLRRTSLRRGLQRVLDSARESASARSQAPGASAALRVLLVEDNEVNQMVADHMLRGLGCAVQAAWNGQQALEAIAAAEQAGQPWDVVLMDVQMPVLDGLAATRRLVAGTPAHRRPWIVAMTANAMAGDRERCLDAGMDDYISKPIRQTDVASALRRAQAGQAARRSA